MTIAFGVHAVYATSLWEDRARVERVAALMLDERWPWRGHYLHVRQVPGTAHSFAPVTREVDAGTVEGALASPVVHQVGVAVSRKEREAHAWMYVQTGRQRLRDSFPLTLRAFCRTPPGHPEQIDTWVSLVDELIVTVRAAHAVIAASSNEDIVHCEVWLQNSSINGRPVHPDPKQISGLAVGRRDLGDRLVRPPHWGTYLSRAHVEAVGGRARLVDVVRPPVVRDVGELLYVQLSDRAADALSPEAEARRAAFAELLAPITVPRIA